MSDPGQMDPRTEALINFLLSGGEQRFGPATPTLSMGQLNLMGGAVPGNPDELDYMRDATNAAQDQASLMADTMFLAQAGPGAYAPGSFNPIETTTRYTSPELDQFLAYIRNPRSYMGRIAAKLQEGVTTEEAVAFLRNEVETNPDAPETQALLAQLPPPPVGTITGETVDWGQVTEDARFVANAYYAIPQEGPFEEDGRSGVRQWEFDETGMPIGMVETTSEPTESMEEYDRLGLPYPTEEFTPEYMLGPEWAAQSEQFQQIGADPMQQALERMLENRPGPMGAEQLRGAGQPWLAEQQGQRSAEEEEAIPAPVPNYPAMATDVTTEVPQALQQAILNGQDAEWMAANWPSIKESDRTASREILASFGLSPALYGFEVQPQEEHPGALEDIGGIPGAVVGANQTSGIPRGESGFVAGEAAEALEGLLGDQRATTEWLRAHYPNLSPEEERGVRGVLADYGLQVEDYIDPGSAVGGSGTRVQAVDLARFLLGTKPTDYQPPAPLPTDNPPTEPGPIGSVTAGSQYGSVPPDYRAMTEAYLAGGGQGHVSNQAAAAPQPAFDYLGALQTAGGLAPQAPPGAADQFYQNIIDTFGSQGTGPITPDNYGGGPQPLAAVPPDYRAMTEAYLAGGGQGHVSNQAAAAAPSQVLPASTMEAMLEFLRSGGMPSRGGIRTGEERPPEAEAEEEEENRRGIRGRPTPTGPGIGPGVLLTGQSRQQGYDRAHDAWVQSFEDYIANRNQVYGYDFGRAGAQALRLQQMGVTPTIAALAARQLVPQAMGIYTPPELR